MRYAVAPLRRIKHQAVPCLAWRANVASGELGADGALRECWRMRAQVGETQSQIQIVKEWLRVRQLKVHVKRIRGRGGNASGCRSL